MIQYDILDANPEGVEIEGSGHNIVFAAEDIVVPWANYLNPGDWFYMTWLIVLDPFDQMRDYLIVEARDPAEALWIVLQNADFGDRLITDEEDRVEWINGVAVDPEAYLIFELWR